MTMPINLFLVRHGESEGNIANRFSYNGDASAFTEQFKSRPISDWRLTDKGIMQAKAAGAWLYCNVISDLLPFDRLYTSYYVRAMETSIYLDLEGDWFPEVYLRERGWGELDNMSMQERNEKYATEMKRRKHDGIFWAPAGGESLADVCLRADRVLTTWHREASNLDLLATCHGEMMRGFELRIERPPLDRFVEKINSDNEHDKIHNCQIIHYTRRNPETGDLAPYVTHVRSVCPWDLTKSSNDWRPIVRQRYTKDFLIDFVNKHPRMLGSDEDVRKLSQDEGNKND